MTTARAADPAGPAAADRRSAVLLAALLLGAGALVGLSPVVGVVTTADASPTTASVVAACTAVLPGILALALAVRRPVLGLAATAGGGVVGLVRLFADLAVIAETDGVTRPELFVETTDRARPLVAGAGAWLLVVADLLMLVAGVLAAERLGQLITASREPGPDDFFGSSRVADEPGAFSMGPTGDSADPSPADSGSMDALSRPPPGRLSMNLPMLSVGFLGAVVLMVGALEISYTGGYLGLRVLPLGSSLTGVLAAALIAVVAAIVVLVAASLPRQIGRALLAGTAAAAAVPPLTAVVAVLTGAPTGLSAAVWWGLAGAVILGASGLLARGGSVRPTPRDSGDQPPAQWLPIGTGVLALLAAAGLAGASQVALLNIDGAAPDELFGVVLAPAGPPMLLAAIPLAITGVMSLVRPTGTAGRAGVAVVWAGAVYALGQALWVRSRVLDSVRNPLNVDLPAEYQHSWTAGPGLWLALISTLLAAAAGVLAVVTERRVDEASPDVVDDGSLADSRAARLWPAVGLTVLTVVALLLPVHGYLGRPASATLLLGYELDTWGVWAVGLATCGAIASAALTRRPPVAAGLPAAAAAVVVQPLFVPSAVRAEAGFALGAGFWAGIVLVAALLAAAGYFAAAAGRVRLVDRSPLAVLLTPRETDPAKAESKGR